MTDDDDDLIDEESILTAEDYIKPTTDVVKGIPLGHWVDYDQFFTGCNDVNPAEGKKRKACKDCSCGLAEKLMQNDESAPPPVKSSCGSVSVNYYGKLRSIVCSAIWAMHFAAQHAHIWVHRHLNQAKRFNLQLSMIYKYYNCTLVGILTSTPTKYANF
jgi:hypothetical protein